MDRSKWRIAHREVGYGVWRLNKIPEDPKVLERPEGLEDTTRPTGEVILEKD